MDEQNKPRARVKKVVENGKSVEKKGEGLGTGPVNNAGNYEDRRQQITEQATQSFQPAQQNHRSGQQPPAQPGNTYGWQQSRPAPPSGFSYGQQPKPQQGTGSGFPFGQSTSRPQQSSSEPQQYHSAVKQNSNSGGQRASGSGTRSSGNGKLIMIVIAALILLGGGGGLSGLFGGGSDNSGSQNALNAVTQTMTQTVTGSNESASDFSNLLGSLLGSGNSAYDFSGGNSLLNSLTGSGNSSDSISHYFTSSGDDNSGYVDENVSENARSKFTTIYGDDRDQMTILVYMCGTDLESQQGMATSDLKEMANAELGDRVNLLVYTGGCSKWRNNVVSSSVNQIYRIQDGKFTCLEKNMGTASMVNPDTLTTFIEYGRKNFPSNRISLILWDHGGGSVSGYGYDEKTGRNQSMTLADINSALKNANVKFDFIGFDACLMATVENGLMLSQYADYMIASEETEPGVGWYYTNWLTKLGKDPSMTTIRIGQQITDDFVAVCERQCRGQATTLSVIDLAELQATIPAELKQFSINTNELIQNNEYKTVSKARSKSREFAQQSRIDQIDLVDFARNMGTDQGRSLAKALQSAVKYNKTGGSISHAYGLSIYFPYQRANKVSQMVSTYKAIGMEEEYTRCIQEFASLEVSGQVSAGTSVINYGNGNSASPDLLGSLLGQGNGYNTYSSGGLTELLGALYGSQSNGGSTGSILDLFMNRSMTADKAADYILNNHFDASSLIWKDGMILLDDSQWDLVTTTLVNVFFNDGNGFIDLGLDNTFETKGNSLIAGFDGTWLAINRQPVAFYFLYSIEEGENYVDCGYVPAMLNGEQVYLILNFDSEHDGDGYIAGAINKYSDSDSDTQAKELIAIGEGDELQFLCDYFDYDGNYRDTYKLGDPIILGQTVEIANVPIQMDKCQVTYRFTDIYNQNYWTPPEP